MECKSNEPNVEKIQVLPLDSTVENRNQNSLKSSQKLSRPITRVKNPNLIVLSKSENIFSLPSTSNDFTKKMKNKTKTTREKTKIDNEDNINFVNSFLTHSNQIGKHIPMKIYAKENQNVNCELKEDSIVFKKIGIQEAHSFESKLNNLIKKHQIQNLFVRNNYEGKMELTKNSFLSIQTNDFNLRTKRIIDQEETVPSETTLFTNFSKSFFKPQDKELRECLQERSNTALKTNFQTQNPKKKFPVICPIKENMKQKLILENSLTESRCEFEITDELEENSLPTTSLNKEKIIDSNSVFKRDNNFISLPSDNDSIKMIVF